MGSEIRCSPHSLWSQKSRAAPPPLVTRAAQLEMSCLYYGLPSFRHSPSFRQSHSSRIVTNRHTSSRCLDSNSGGEQRRWVVLARAMILLWCSSLYVQYLIKKCFVPMKAWVVGVIWNVCCELAAVGHVLIKEIVIIRPNGVVGIMFFLHEWAEVVCWFDSVKV